MRNRIRAAHATAWLLGGATFVVSGSAMAAACPVDSNTVYMSGSTAFSPVLQSLVNVLTAIGSPVKIVSQKPGSCEGLDPVVNHTGDTHSASLLVANATAMPCDLPQAGATVDIGISGVYPSTCRATFDTSLPDLGAAFADFLGPIQAITIAVPTNSSENLISAEAAHVVFGFDAATAANTIAPWSIPGDIYVRFWDSGTLELVGAAINLPGGKWANATTTPAPPQQQSGGGALATALVTSGNMAGHTNSTIGILGTANLTTGIKPLAFQGVGQSCSYLPDSTSSAADKINVRQGRYTIWGPEHLVTNVDGSGKPVGQNNNTAAVQTVINGLTSTSKALPSQSDAGAGDGGVTSLGESDVGQIITTIAKPSIGFIPWCAMQVQRTSEIGAESSYAPPAACTCAYEYATGAPVTGHTCTACTAQNAATTCIGATPACHFGYCEAE